MNEPIFTIHKTARYAKTQTTDAHEPRWLRCRARRTAGWIGTIGSDLPLGEFMGNLLETSDTMILGSKTTNEIVSYWENVAENEPDSPEQPVAQKMVRMRKIAFSKRQSTISGKNVTVENGDIVSAVNQLKNEDGKDIIVYGGAQFVSALIEHDLIDEYNLFINPISLGNGLSIFKGKKYLKLAKSVVYRSGIVVNTYIKG
ncbi:dihydrofolate reductase family protein [Chitinophaga lutea]|uniref:dihydrofolate reductase family protein n=1 Tax=Chitinophaga lutea TaxID=2488634 RepID=UPI001C706E5F|nr:dihydrofolate reductase family protein [Chitinophaga lutea]